MRQWRAVASGVALASVIAIVGCSKKQAAAPLASAPVSQQLPFERPPSGGGLAPTATLVPRGIQAETRIVVRLPADLSSDRFHAGQWFQATLDYPLFFEGHIVARRGSPISGKILSAKAPASESAGYLRLTIVSLTVDGQSVPVHTSSAFLRGRTTAGIELAANPTESRQKPVGTPVLAGDNLDATKPEAAPEGRRISVRLTEPILLPIESPN